MESQLKEDLEEAGYRYNGTSDASYYCPVDQCRETLELLLGLDWIVEDARGRTLEAGAVLNVEISEQTIKGGLVCRDQVVPVHDLLGAQDRGQAFVALSDNRVALLPSKEEMSGLDALGDVREWIQEGGLSRSRSLSLLEDLQEIQGVQFSQDLEELKDRFEQVRVGEGKPGPGFTGTLRPYQQEGVQWLELFERSRTWWASGR